MPQRSKDSKNIVIITLVLSIFFLILLSNIKNSFALDSKKSLIIPLNSQILEFSENKGTSHNISYIDIELPSSTWNITDIEMNFTDIEYSNREVKIIEDNPIMDDIILDKQHLKGIAVQIKLDNTIKIYGAYLYINASNVHQQDIVTFQLRGYNSSINAPNNTIYSSVDLNHTINDGWNYQNLITPITLPKGNYYLVMEGYVHAAGEYLWYYNNFNPNNPDLYRSEINGSGWIDGIQGSPFLYKLDQEIKERDFYPEEFNMIAKINGVSYQIQNGNNVGSGTLKLQDINFSPNNEILHIPIRPYGFFFNLSYHLNLKNQFLSSGFINITEETDNSWKIIFDTTQRNYNYSIKIELPNNFYNLVVSKDNVDISLSENIGISGNLLKILNDTINDDANFEITVKSPKIAFTLDNSRGTVFHLGEELIFSAIAPVREGNFTFILYNELGAELDKKIIPVTTDEIVYTFNIPSSASLGNWITTVYWNSYSGAGVESQAFTIIPAESPPGNGVFPIGFSIILIIGFTVIGGTVTSLTVYRQAHKRKMIRIEFENSKVYNKFKDILSLNYLMISDIKSGVNVYEQFFTGKFLDPSLISGFLDAMRNFGIELTGSYKKSETLTLDYEDSIILMNEPDSFRLIIIMSEKPSEEFASSITNLAKDIEGKYGEAIREFRGGDVTQFAGLKELIEIHLNVSFAFPLKIVMTKKVKLNDMEKTVMAKANEIMNQTDSRYFYTTFLMPDQKFDLETTNTIFDLIRKGVFQPVELDVNDEL
ncbi:MAG: hypothetical protein ACXACO_18590 [Promethearchaeota archaeon]|jgi:hypothetical protein